MSSVKLNAEIKNTAITSQTIAACFGQSVVESKAVLRVVIDSRKVQSGDLYVAIKGERNNGHEYLAQAFERGAVAAVISEPCKGCHGALIHVPDTTQALGLIGQYWRSVRKARIAAVTGSNGKTTVSHICQSILSEGHLCIAPTGSYNNHWGVPLTLTKIDEDTDFGVIEMGMNHAGELAYLTQLAQPNCAVITNAGSAHLEGLGSLEAVARAKAEIIEGVPEHGSVVLNHDDTFLPLWKAKAGPRKVTTFGLSEKAGVRASAVVCGTQGSQFVCHLAGQTFDVQLKLLGTHNVMNALAAIAVCHELGMDVSALKQGCAAARAVSGRLQLMKLANTLSVINDSYNANPGSMQAAIDVLVKQTGKSVLVLGAMAEIGGDSNLAHEQIGAYAKAQGVESLIAVGSAGTHYKQGFGPGTIVVENHEHAAAAVLSAANHSTTVLVKGSRSAAMENVVKALGATPC